MKISRIALLSAVLFVAPYACADDGPKTTDTTSTNSITPSQQAPETPKDKISNDVQNIKDELSNVGDKAKSDASSLVAKLGGFIAVPFVAVSGLADKIANKTYLNSVIGSVTNTKYLKDTRINNPALIGQMVVFALAAGITYKLYDMYNAQNEDNDELIFESEYDND